MPDHTDVPGPLRRIGRRSVLVGGAAAVASAAAGLSVGTAARAESAASSEAVGSAVELCWGPTQAGIATAPQAFATLVALRLAEGATRASLVRLMRLWTDDIERLTQGEPALADLQPEVAAVPARLTVTVGYGPGLFDVPGLARQRPDWLAPLPAFEVDRLRPEWSGGDLLLQVAADDPIAVSHAVGILVRDASGFATPLWTQRGFRRSPGATPPGSTGRNLMGQVDGTVNPVAGTDDFAEVVTAQDGPAWVRGGTGVVVRRIRMNLDQWASVDRHAREQIIGRDLAAGAPLTGTAEQDPPDFDAVDENGMLVIPEFAHIRLAHPNRPQERILRRPYNYDDGVAAGEKPDAGLLFIAFAADVTRQFVPIQRRLDKVDLLNIWTTPVGSAVFAVPPGFERGGWIGEGLLA